MAIVVIIVVSTLIILYQQQKQDLARQRQENDVLRLQAEQATADMKQLPPKETSIAKSTPANPSTKHFMELLRLRGEVGRLRQRLFDHTNRVTQRTHDEELV